MERMLRYSLTHQQPIRVIFQTQEGKLVQRKATVTQLDDQQVTLRSLRPKGEVTIPLFSLLGADYIRGDDGQSKEEQP